MNPLDFSFEFRKISLVYTIGSFQPCCITLILLAKHFNPEADECIDNLLQCPFLSDPDMMCCQPSDEPH
jgi:hypothetical protein